MNTVNCMRLRELVFNLISGKSNADEFREITGLDIPEVLEILKEQSDI